jgi:hypothetical protein
LRKQFQRELKSVVEGELMRARDTRIMQERKLRYQEKLQKIEQNKLSGVKPVVSTASKEQTV